MPPATDPARPRPWVAAFKSRVARRVVLLFFVCAVVPMVSVGVVSYAYVGRQLTRDAELRVERGAKLSGQAVIARLRNIEVALRAVARTLTLQGSTVPSDSLAVEGSQALMWVHPGGTRMLDGRAFEPPPLSESVRQFLRAGGSVMLDGRDADRVPAPLMVHGAGPDEDFAGLLWAVIDPAYVSDSLPFAPMDATVCLFGWGRTVACPLPGADSLRTAVTPGDREAAPFSTGGPRRVRRWSGGEAGAQYLVGHWEIFLKPSFFADPWQIAVVESRADVLQPLASFNRTFPFILVLALLIVLLFSNVQIRRSLEPLTRLTAGTRRVARRDFSEPVTIRSGDEFQELADSFNAMAGRLDRQFRVLETRSEIDRAVLATLDVERLAATVLAGLPATVGSDTVTVALGPDEGDGGWQVRSRVGGDPPVATWATPGAREIHELEASPGSRWLAGPPFPSYVPASLDELGLLVLPLLLSGRAAGALLLGYRNRTPTDEERDAARQMADQVTVALANARLVNRLELMSWGTLQALARAIDAKSPWTAGHSERVTDLALAIGRRLGLERTALEDLHRGGLLHDVGKIGVDNELLDKASPLTPGERDLMRRHVQIGAQIIAPIPGYAGAVPVVLHHHERWDGTGYPDGLRGEAIPRLARILSVADAYDALTSDRPYRAGLPPLEAVGRIQRDVARQFDPAVAEAFLAEIASRGTSRRPAAGE